MLSHGQFDYVDDALRRGPTVKPREVPDPFRDGNEPWHLDCHVTAMHLEGSRSWGAQIGIQWLDRLGLLVPWPHVINWVGGELVDFSCPIVEPKLGFTLIGNDVEMANALTDAIDATERVGGARA